MTSDIFKIVAKEVGWLLLIWIFFYVAALFFFLLLEAAGFSDSPTDSATVIDGLTSKFFLATLFANNIAFLFFAILRTDIEQGKIIEWKNKRIKLSFFKYICFGVLAAIIFLAFQYLEYLTLSPFFDKAELSKTLWDETRGFDLAEKLVLLFDAVIATPFVIELYFRQAMLGSIHRKGYPNFAMFFSCAVFAVIHFDFLHIFAYLFSAVVFAFLYLKTRSLIPSIIAHSLINLISFSYILFG